MKHHHPTLAHPEPTALGAELVSRYGAGLRRRYLILAALGVLTVLLALQAVAVGAYDLSPYKVLLILLGQGEGAQSVVVFNIRLPRIAAAIVTGWGLGISGLLTQSLLRNPLASPFTLGMSHGAMFGAAFAIVFMGAGAVTTSGLYTSDSGNFMFTSLYAVTLMAFAGAMAATAVILLLARMRQMNASAVILAGVAMASLFMSGTVLIQYFATEVEIATVVFWTFGDVARSNWREITVLTVATLGVSLYFLRRRWDLNALLAGEETAQALGVHVTRLRLLGMFLASLAGGPGHRLPRHHRLPGPAGPAHQPPPGGRRPPPFWCPVRAWWARCCLLAADTVGRMVLGFGQHAGGGAHLLHGRAPVPLSAAQGETAMTLEARDLHSSPTTAGRCCDGLSLSLEHGEITGILGVNGAGKSTLLQMPQPHPAPPKGRGHGGGPRPEQAGRRADRPAHRLRGPEPGARAPERVRRGAPGTQAPHQMASHLPRPGGGHQGARSTWAWSPWPCARCPASAAARPKR